MLHLKNVCAGYGNGDILHDITIDLPMPRDRSSREFVAYRNDILNKLHFGGTSKAEEA